MLTRGDKVLIYILLSLALGSFFLLFFLGGTKAGLKKSFSSSTVLVSIKGEKREYPLNQRKKVRIAGAKGACILEISQKKVRVASSSCPRKICVEQGWISKPGDSIICVPMGIVITLSDSQENRKGEGFINKGRVSSTAKGDFIDAISW